MLRFLALYLFTGSLLAQLPAPTGRLSSDEAFDRALANNVLTAGSQPFHAILSIAPQKSPDPAYSGRVEIYWQSPTAYRVIVESRDFAQTSIVSGEQIQETNRGDFYPRWLQDFVTALLDPMPRLKDLRGRADTVPLGPQLTFSCVRRDDKNAGITNDLTWAQVCFDGEAPRLGFAMDFTYNMEFNDPRPFGPQLIARTYVTGAGNNQRLTGTLSTLEKWTPDPALLSVLHSTPVDQRITTTFVSTLTEESRLESAPRPFCLGV